MSSSPVCRKRCSRIEAAEHCCCIGVVNETCQLNNDSSRAVENNKCRVFVAMMLRDERLRCKQRLSRIVGRSVVGWSSGQYA